MSNGENHDLVRVAGIAAEALQRFIVSHPWHVGNEDLAVIAEGLAIVETQIQVCRSMVEREIECPSLH